MYASVWPLSDTVLSKHVNVVYDNSRCLCEVDSKSMMSSVYIIAYDVTYCSQICGAEAGM